MGDLENHLCQHPLEKALTGSASIAALFWKHQGWFLWFGTLNICATVHENRPPNRIVHDLYNLMIQFLD